MTKPIKKPISKNGRYAAYDRFLESIPPRSMAKRAKYLHGIGVFRGMRGDTAWIKIRLIHGGLFKGKYYKASDSVEFKVGNLESYSWADLERIYQDYQSKADRGESLEEVQVPLFSEYATDWLKVKKNQHRGYKTTKGIVDNHLLQVFGHKPLDAISRGDVNRWQGQQLAKCAPATVKRQRVVLQSLLSDAKKAEHIAVNPCDNADGIKVPEAEPRYLTGEELARLLACAQEEADWLPEYVIIAVHMGLRRGEMMGLKWSHVISAPNGTFLRFPTGKTQKIRTIHCSKTVEASLGRLKSKRDDSDARVFQVSLKTLIRRWQAARKSAGLEDVRIQDLRSTNATYAVLSGVDLNTVAKGLGHSNTDMLQRHYAAMTEAGVIEASGKIEAALSSAMSVAKNTGN